MLHVMFTWPTIPFTCDAQVQHPLFVMFCCALKKLFTFATNHVYLDCIVLGSWHNGIIDNIHTLRVAVVSVLKVQQLPAWWCLPCGHAPSSVTHTQCNTFLWIHLKQKSFFSFLFYTLGLGFVVVVFCEFFCCCCFLQGGGRGKNHNCQQ